MTTSDPEVTGTLPPPTQPAADTLLLLPDRLEGADPADNFQSLDMSYGWLNTLTQEQGAVRHAQIARFVPGLLGDVRLLRMQRRDRERGSEQPRTGAAPRGGMGVGTVGDRQM